MVSDRAFIFHIYIPWGKTLSLVSQGHLSRSRSNIKVTVTKKIAVAGALAFHKHSLFHHFFTENQATALERGHPCMGSSCLG